MTIRIVRQSVTEVAGGDPVIVRDAAPSKIEIQWSCGDAFLFSADALRLAIASVEDVTGAWVALTDENGLEGAVFREGDVIYAESEPTDDPSAGDGVLWDELRRALSRALRQTEGSQT